MRAPTGLSGRFALFAAACLAAFPALADENADFYRNKQMNMVIAFAPGGGYDLYARLVGRHIGKHLPGNPQVIPQNMPLAGGLKAANFLYEIAPRDGTTLGAIAHNVMEQQVLGGEGIAYQAQKFNWIGRLNIISEAEIVWRDSGVTGLDDAFRREIVVGASGPTGSPTIYPRVLNVIAGTKFRIVTGYAGAPESCLAMERGEVMGCLIDFGNIKTTKRHWIEQNKIRVLFQMGATRDPVFPDVPVYASLGKTEEERQTLGVFSMSAEVGRSIMAPPGVPPERVAALRKAFDAMTRDPEFIADAAKSSLELATLPGVDLQAMIERAADIPPAVVARARSAREGR